MPDVNTSNRLVWLEGVMYLLCAVALILGVVAFGIVVSRQIPGETHMVNAWLSSSAGKENPFTLVDGHTHAWQLSNTGGIDDGAMLYLTSSLDNEAPPPVPGSVLLSPDSERVWAGLEGNFPLTPARVQNDAFRICFWARAPGNFSSQSVPNPDSTGLCLREWWSGIGGINVEDLTSQPTYPDTPTGREFIASMKGPNNWGTDYGTRISGFLIPPETGDYTFWCTGDDQTQFYLSSDETPANLTYLCGIPLNSWANENQWDKFPEQTSAPIALAEGAKLYFEMLHKEGGGGDNCAVKWQLPSGPEENPIPGERLKQPVNAIDSADLVHADVWLQDLGMEGSDGTEPPVPPTTAPVTDPDFATYRMVWVGRVRPSRSLVFDGEATYDALAPTSPWCLYTYHVNHSKWAGHRFRLWFAFTSGMPLAHVDGTVVVSGGVEVSYTAL